MLSPFVFLLFMLCFATLLGVPRVRKFEQIKDKNSHLFKLDSQETSKEHFDFERQLSGTCVKTHQESSSCVNCLNSTTVNATSGWSMSMGWCSEPSFCFDASLSSNVIACSDKCKGDVYYTSDSDYESECSESTLSLTSIILIFIIVVVCPVCLVGSCIALLCYRCHNAVGNKIAVGRDMHDNDLVNTVTPVPVLNVYNGYSNVGSAYPMTAVATIQEPTVINVDEVNGFKTSASSNVNNINRSSGKTGVVGSSRNYSALSVTHSGSSSSNRYSANVDP